MTKISVINENAFLPYPYLIMPKGGKGSVLFCFKF